MTWTSTKDLDPYKIFKSVYEDVGECPNCHQRMLRKKGLSNITHKKLPAVCPMCGYRESKEEYEKQLKQDITFTLQARKNTALGFFTKYSVFGNSSITNASFANYTALTSPEKQAFEKSKSISSKMVNEIVHSIFVGGTGRGKSHLAMSIVKELWRLTDYSKKVMFISFPELISEMKQGMSNPDIQKFVDQVMYQISNKKMDMIVIDDLGAERKTDFALSVIDTLGQVVEDTSVIVTTNLTGKELVQIYGERFISRLKNHGVGNSISFSNINDHRG